MKAKLGLDHTCPISVHYKGFAIRDMLKEEKAFSFLVWCARKGILEFTEEVVEIMEEGL